METTPQTEKTPHTKLITQNLLTSAALFEHSDSITWQSVQDLAALIDLFCLYDHGIVLGRNVVAKLHDWNSDLLDLISGTGFIEVQYPSHSSTDKVTRVARRHLLSFLGEEETSRFDAFLNEALNARHVDYLLLATPDDEYHIKTGREWLLTTPSHLDLVKQLEKERAISRSANYLVRSFLYLAYADVSKLAFTPDAARCPVVDAVLTREEEFRTKLLKGLNEPWTSGMGDKELMSRVSPFAAVVFERAGKNKQRVVPEIRKLRDDLKDDRSHLLSLEDKILWGSHAERLDATKKYNQVITELVSSFGVSNPLEITFKFILDMASDIGEVADDPKKVSSWAKLITLPDHIVKRITARNTSVGIHRLIQNPNLPAPEKLRSTIFHLFGDIQE